MVERKRIMGLAMRQIIARNQGGEWPTNKVEVGCVGGQKKAVSDDHQKPIQ
jgi:hypothetical protein